MTTKEELEKIRAEFNKKFPNMEDKQFAIINHKDYENAIENIADYFLSLIEEKYISRRELEEWAKETKKGYPGLQYRYGKEVCDDLLTFLSNK